MALAAKKITQYDSLAEAQFYAERSLPKMYKNTVSIMPLLLTVPLFSISRADEDAETEQVSAVWHNKGRGYVSYNGPALTQSHQTAFLALAKIRAGQPVGNVIEFFPTELLQAMGWSDNSRNQKRLRKLLDDMHDASLRLWREGQDEEKDASRVRFFAEWTPSTADKWQVVLSPTVLRLFDGHLTHLNIEKRQSLKEGLPTFLYGYICANSCDVPFSYEDLHAAAGSNATSIKKFGEDVRETLARMADKDVIRGFAPSRGKVRVFK